MAIAWGAHPRLVPFEAPKAKSGVANGSSKPNGPVENRRLTHMSLREVKDLELFMAVSNILHFP